MKKSIMQSIRMFEAVLDGQTYSAIAATSNLPRSTVERRVKDLVGDLQAVVGVEGVEEDVMPTVYTMRRMRNSYLEALEHYQPERAKRTRPRRTLITGQELDLAIDKIRQMSTCKSRDIALLLILFSTAAKPLEIARLEVRDYLDEEGTIRKESTMRPESAIGGEARPLFFASAKTNAAIDAYLLERGRRRQGVRQSNSYRGLDPMSRLFLTAEGNAMPIQIVKHRNNRQYQHCYAILNIYRKIFERTGLQGVTVSSARRTIAGQLKERGVNNDSIGKLLGLKRKESVRKLLRKQGQPLRHAVRELI